MANMLFLYCAACEIAIYDEIHNCATLSFVVPTVTFRVLVVLGLLAHERRRVLHVNSTEHPTAQWTAQQVVDALPWDEAPRSLLRDRDAIYGAPFRQRVKHMGIEAVLIAPQSPWQNHYVERLIGSIRRKCFDHVIVLHEQHLQRLLSSYFAYDPRWRTHLSLAMSCPVARPVEPPEVGAVIALPVPAVGGLHHHYARQAAWAYAEPLALQTFQDGFVREAFFLREKLKKLLDRCLELTLRPIAYFPQILLAERPIGNPTRNLLNAADVGIPAHEIDE